MRPVICETTTTVRAPRAATFDRAVPIDLASIFRGYGPLPAIVATEDATGSWDTAGRTRTVRFSDGSTAREALTDYDRPRYFAYRVSRFTGPLRFLTNGARGEWWLEEAANGSTSIRWRYAFTPHSALMRPVLWVAVRLLWRGYMNAALRATREQIEASVASRRRL